MAMKNPEFEVKLLEKLDEVVDRLNLLIELSVPPLNVEGLELGEVERDVLALCDLRHTTKDIASRLRKTPNNMKQIVFQLRKKGLIESVKIRKETYYARLRR